MTYITFSKLYDQALEYDNEEFYVAERGWEEWMNEYEDNINIIREIMWKTYQFAHGNISELRKEMKMSVPAFGKQFGIPRRTIQDWEYGKNDISIYTKKMLVYIGLTEYLLREWEDKKDDE